MALSRSEELQMVKYIRSIDISLGRIAKALEDQNELLKVDAVIKSSDEEE